MNLSVRLLLRVFLPWPERPTELPRLPKLYFDLHHHHAGKPVSSSRTANGSDERHASVQHLLYPERAAYAQHYNFACGCTCKVRLLRLYAFSHQNADAG